MHSVAFILGTGCHKKNGLVCCEPLSFFPDTGNWRMVQVSGGLAGITRSLPADSGGLRLADAPAGAMAGDLGVRFSGDSSILYLLRTDQDSLMLTQSVADGFEFTYLRQQ
jgi:hypothetical protein